MNMKEKDFFRELLDELYKPEEFPGSQLVFRTSADLRTDFGGMVELDVVDIGEVMRKKGYRIVKIGHIPYWAMYGREDCPIGWGGE